jgi:hypothetical protein
VDAENRENEGRNKKVGKISSFYYRFAGKQSSLAAAAVRVFETRFFSEGGVKRVKRI